MIRHVAARSILFFVAMPLAAQQAEDPARLVARLGTERTAATHAALVALGEAAVPALVESLRAGDPPALREVLSVLRELGPAAGAAVPPLRDALATVPADDVNVLLSTLADLVPYRAPDVAMGYQGLLRVMYGLQGGLKRPRLHDPVLRVDPKSTLQHLEASLQSETVLCREVALRLLRERGATARPVLPALAMMLDEEQPKHGVATFVDARTGGFREIDRTQIVHRLAAQAILAIAPRHDSLAARARRILDESK